MQAGLARVGHGSSRGISFFTRGFFMLSRNHLLAGAAALVALSLVGPAAAQAPIKLGELNSYKAFPAFLEPYKKGWELAVEEATAAGGVPGRTIQGGGRGHQGKPAQPAARPGGPS